MGDEPSVRRTSTSGASTMPAAGKGVPAVLEVEQEAEGQAAPGGIAAHDDVVGRRAFLEEMLVRGPCIGERGRKRIFGRQPIAHVGHGGSAGQRQPGLELPVGQEGAAEYPPPWK